LPDGGKNATEEQIADAVRDLLVRANRGPQPTAGPKPSKRDRRVAARTRATRPPQPQPDPTPVADLNPRTGENIEPETTHDDAQVAKVIPLPIFDPFAEANKRW
jgi:hypothetical protein